MTVVMESFHSKDEIFEAYLNEIYLGQRSSASVHGFGEASRFYFSKPVRHLTIGEQALLGGLIRSPGRYSPYLKPESALGRRNLVLKKLLEEEKITQEQHDRAVKEEIRPRGRRNSSRSARYFIDYVQKELVQRFSEASLGKKGYEIFTTLDSAQQRFAEVAVEEGLKQIQKGRKEGLQAALLSIHPRTGTIKAMVGGRDYSKSQYNRVLRAKRQPGSLIKPFVTALALTPKEGQKLPEITPSTTLEDRPATFSYSGRDWSPKNYDGKYGGTVTVRGALERSLNVATVNLASMIGIDRLAHGLKAFGFSGIQPFPSIALGSVETTPLHVAQAYSALANSGLQTDVKGITAVVGEGRKRLEQQSIELKRTLSAEVASQVTYLLQGVVDRGTAARIRAEGMAHVIAGKTGTSDDYRDSWFVGYTPSLLTVVWVGYDDGESTKLTGSSGALKVWIRYMKEVLKRVPDEPFQVDRDLESFQVDALRGCMGSRNETLQELFYPGTKPPTCQN